MLIVPSMWGCGDKRHEEHSGEESAMLTFKDCHRFLSAVNAIMGKLLPLATHRHLESTAT